MSAVFLYCGRIEHYSHKNILKYCKRPFASVREMNETLIANHNSVVGKGDVTVHAGDFFLGNPAGGALEIIRRLNGTHVFINGSHDRWLSRMNRGEVKYHDIWHKTIDEQTVVVCHYAMRVWHKSHFNSWHLYGHSHGNLAPEGKSWDVGVDNNNFMPVSWEQVKVIMASRPDNFNLVNPKDRRD